MTNLVTIAIDDLFAYDQFRDSFGVRIETPNLDRLMGRSVNFENAYASVAICAPSRAATMSGKTPWETGVHDNFTDLFDVVDPLDTWPAMIRDNGYFATSSGKVFHSKGTTEAVQSVYSERIDVTRSTLTGERVLTEGGKKWAYLGEDADLNDHDVATFGLEFLDRAPEGQPFLLTLGFDHPHTAYFAPARYFELYPIDALRVPETWVEGDLSDVPAFAQQFASQPRGGEPFADLAEWKAVVQGYLAAISHMDAQVGRFLDGLAASGHADDTAILLYSDHGYQLGAKDHPVKFTLWEESAKAPMMLYVPGAEAKTVSTPVSLMDIMPTVLDLTGTPIPAGLSGQSLLPFVIGDGAGYDAGPVLTSMYGSFAIRSGDHRFIRYQDGGEELYDLATDPGQVTNLVTDPAFGALSDRLRAELLAEAREAGALIDPDAPVFRGTGGADQGVASPGNLSMALGGGDDVYFVYENGTAIIEAAAGGFDTVFYTGSAPYRTPQNIERVFATLPDNRLGHVEIIGNDQDNTLNSGFVRGIFHGEGGNDTLIGGRWTGHELYGGTGQDRLLGANQLDLLYGGEGNDFITGAGKGDLIFGGGGNDRIDGGNDNDRIHGGTGIDNLRGDKGNDAIFGGEGGDFIGGDQGRDRIEGGAGDDRIYGGYDADSLSGGAGADRLELVAGDDLALGGAGRDTYVIHVQAGHRIIDETGSSEVDRIEFARADRDGVALYRDAGALLIRDGPDRSVWIDGAADNRADVVVFDDAETTLGALWDAAAWRDFAAEGYGDQTVTGTSHADLFYGHVGDDSYVGKSGDDTLLGGAGADLLNGGNGSDHLFGGRGDDTLIGSHDDDLLDGGAGSDSLSGGSGADSYVYRAGDGDLIIDDKGFGDGDLLTVTGWGIGDASARFEGADLVYLLPDASTIRIVSFAADRGRIETILLDGVAAPLSPVNGDPGLRIGRPPPPELDTGGTVRGTDGNDRLFGTAGDETLTDGAGRDNLFGRAGADIFALSADGVADSIKDFETARDWIDLTAWGVSSLDDLAISEGAGKVIVRAEGEVLSVTDTARTLAAGDLDADHFIFAEPSDEPVDDVVGTDAGERLYGDAGGQTLSDHGGKDNLFGGGGADTFVLAADGVADAIRDFEAGIDLIDIGLWGAEGFGALRILQGGGGKVAVRFGAESLSIATTDGPFAISDLTEDAFVF